jgi:8-oxo-dGTP pyrophosphatase MutT (NUDIX family)
LLAPITELHGEAAIVVTKRPATMLHHQNDWVFPGGRLDAAHDRDTLETAIRETAEELGTPASRIEVIGRLSTHGPIVTGFLIDAYVGLVDIADIAPDPAEVADWAVLPISALTAPGAFRSSSVMPAHHTGPTVAELDPGRPGGRLSFFKIEGEEELWGLQGAVLHELLDWLFGESEAEKPRP